MAEKRNGAGSRLAGLLERPTRPDDVEEPDPAADPAEGEPAEPAKGRGVAPAPKKTKGVEARAAKKIRGRTVYIPDDLFERVIVQAHRKNRTISEYVVGILDRQVPDHRVIRSGSAETDGA
jgi:hypothetical protein